MRYLMIYQLEIRTKEKKTNSEKHPTNENR